MADDRNTGGNQDFGKQEAIKNPETLPAPPVPNHNEPDTNRNQRHPQNEPKEKWGHNPNTWMVGITFLLAVLGVVTAVIFYGQWKEMIGQTNLANIAARQARKDSADSSAKVEQQLRIAQQQAKAAIDSANESRRATDLLRTANERAKTQWEAEHRPWIGNGEIGFRQAPVFLFYPDNPIEGKMQVSFIIEVPIKNVGVSPAFHVETMLMGTMTEKIAAPSTMESMMVSACQQADNHAKNIGGVLFPNSPETRFEQNTNILGPIAQISEVHRVWITICTAYSGTTSGEHLQHTKVWLASWPIDGQPTEVRRTTDPTVIYYSLPITRWSVVKTEAD